MNLESVIRTAKQISTFSTKVDLTHDTPMIRLATLIVTIICMLVYIIQAEVGMDDAFIYFRIANNIINGNGPVFNVGDMHMPATSPLWLYLLAFGKYITSLDLIEVSKFLYLIFLIITSYVSYQLLCKKIGWGVILLPIAIFFNKVTVSYLGGEVALANCLIILILWAYVIRNNLSLTFFLIALAYLTRGEIVLIALPIALHAAWPMLKSGQLWRAIKSLFMPSLIFIVVVSSWHAFYYYTFEQVFPSTLHAKIVQGELGIFPNYGESLWTKIKIFVNNQLLLLPIFIISSLFLGRALLIFLIFAILHAISYSILGVPFYHWYYYDINLFIAIIGVGGVAIWTDVLAKRIKIKNRYIGFVAGVALSALFVYNTSVIYKMKNAQHDMMNRYDYYHGFAELYRNKLDSNKTMLVDEIGILGYDLDNLIIRDQCGLASPNMSAEQMFNNHYYTNYYKPEYLMLTARKQLNNYVFVDSGRISYYEKIYVYDEKARYYNVSLFERKETKIQVDKLFQEMIQHSARTYDKPMLTVGKRFIELRHRGMLESVINVPSNSKELSFNLGLSNEKNEVVINIELAYLNENGKKDIIYTKDVNDMNSLKQKKMKIKLDNFKGDGQLLIKIMSSKFSKKYNHIVRNIKLR